MGCLAEMPSEIAKAAMPQIIHLLIMTRAEGPITTRCTLPLAFMWKFSGRGEFSQFYPRQISLSFELTFRGHYQSMSPLNIESPPSQFRKLLITYSPTNQAVEFIDVMSGLDAAYGEVTQAFVRVETSSLSIAMPFTTLPF